MFELQCMEYLKELEQDPQNTSIRNSLRDLISKNSSKVDSFIVQFNLNSDQKQLLLELMQESSQNESSNLSSNTITQHSQQNMDNIYNSFAMKTGKINSNSQEQISELHISSENEGFYQEVMKYFTTWRNEYFKLGSVSPQCVEIGEMFINKVLSTNNSINKEYLELFESLPEQSNEMFKKFKNNIINIIISQLLEEVTKELTIIRTSSLNWLQKFKLAFKFERLEKKIAKRKISLDELSKLQQESNSIRQASN